MRRLSEQEMIEKTNRQMQSHMEANKVKDSLGHKGYTFTMSLYGIIVNFDTKLPEYRRIEVFINGPPTQSDVLNIMHFFDEFTPWNYYSIWAYNRETKEILCIEEWD